MGVKWTTDQQHAIECCKGSVLVSAAAGSGKTTVLVERVIRRLTDEAAKKITTVASTGESPSKVNNIPAGYAAAPAASADENVLVKLLG